MKKNHMISEAKNIMLKKAGLCYFEVNKKYFPSVLSQKHKSK